MNKIIEVSKAGLAGDEKRLKILIAQEKITKTEYQVKNAAVKLELAKIELVLAKAELEKLKQVKMRTY